MSISPISSNSNYLGFQPSKSYILLIQEIVATSLELQETTLQKDRLQIHELKKRFKDLTQDSAQSQRQLGSSQFKWSFLTLGGTFLQFFFTQQSDREIVNTFARECLPKFCDFFHTQTQAKMQ